MSDRRRIPARTAELPIAIVASLAICSLLIAPSCKRSQPAPDPLDGGELVFSDDFERDAFGEAWNTSSDAWTLEDGVVHVAGARNEGLWLARPLPEDVRIEFDARSESEEGDIKFEMFTDGQTHQSGYVGIFGGWDNQLNIIARLDEHGDDRLVGQQGVHVEPGRIYRMAIVRTDGRIRWYVDGEPFLTYHDAQPLTGPDHAYFGFNDWEAPLRFDNLAVYDLSAD